MKRLKLKKLFRVPVKGVPAHEIIKAGNPDTVALLPSRIPYIKPGLLVHEGDSVLKGSPLFHDKRDNRISFLSPGGGVVEKITFGLRRVIEEIVIRLDREELSEELSVDMSSIIPESLADPSDPFKKGDILELLLNAGMWQSFRQFPFMDIADYKSVIPMIIVSLQPGDQLSPVAGAIIKGQEKYFLKGLEAISTLSENIIVAAPESFMSENGSNFKNVQDKVTHITEDYYPAGDPGVILYQIKKNATENTSVTIDPQEVIAIGELLLNRSLPISKVYTAAGLTNNPPSHIVARRGCPMEQITGKVEQSRALLAGGLFTGTLSLPESPKHMGSDVSSAIVLEKASKDKMFGFIYPGSDTMTLSRTFLSSFIGRYRGSSIKDGHASLQDTFIDATDGFLADVNLHGEPRPCINCGYCDKICPVDLLPQFIMKAVLAGELEEGIEMGLLDCTRCNLCTFVCPSKIDLGKIMGSSKESCYRDRMAEN